MALKVLNDEPNGVFICISIMSSSSSACNIAGKRPQKLKKKLEYNNNNIKNCTQRDGQQCQQPQIGSNDLCLGRAIPLPVKSCEPAGYFCCLSNNMPSAHMALSDFVMYRTHKHLCGLSSHLIHIHTHFFHNCLPFCLNTPFTHMQRLE